MFLAKINCFIADIFSLTAKTINRFKLIKSIGQLILADF